MRKLKEWPKNKKIVAIDFDGTITMGDTRIWVGKNKYKNDVFIGNPKMIQSILDNRDKIYLILWTCRTGKALKDAIKFCKEHNIYFDAINKNIVRYKTSNKIMADIYIDDKGEYLEWERKL